MKKRELQDLIDGMAKVAISEIDLGTDEETLVRGMRFLKLLQRLMLENNEDIESIKAQLEETNERLNDISNEIKLMNELKTFED